MNPEELGILKGKYHNNFLAYYFTLLSFSNRILTATIYPEEKIASEQFNSILNNVCCVARIRQKMPEQ